MTAIETITAIEAMVAIQTRTVIEAMAAIQTRTVIEVMAATETTAARLRRLRLEKNNETVGYA